MKHTIKIAYVVVFQVIFFSFLYSQNNISFLQGKKKEYYGRSFGTFYGLSKLSGNNFQELIITPGVKDLLEKSANKSVEQSDVIEKKEAPVIKLAQGQGHSHQMISDALRDAPKGAPQDDRGEKFMEKAVIKLVQAQGHSHQMISDVERREGLEEQKIDDQMLYEDETGEKKLKKKTELEKTAEIAKKILKPKEEMVADVERREAGKVALLKDLAKDKAAKVDGPRVMIPVKPKFLYHILGGVAFESMYDSRQVIGSRYNEFIFAPAPQELDPNGLDINAKDQFNMMGVRAACSLHVRGPKIWDALTSAVIEGEFNGIQDDTVRLFRLERAHANFDWERTTLLLGHYYHPLVLDEMFPETISRGHGIVYDPFQFAPQVKLRHRLKNFELVFAVAKDFEVQTARWATLPDVFFQINLHAGNQLLGAGVNYHVVVPRIFTEVPPVAERAEGADADQTFKTNEQVASIYPFAFALLRFNPFELRVRATYAQNGSVYDIIGAYGVCERSPVTDERLYTNLRTITFWADFIYKRNYRIEPAIFFGVAKNLGARERILRGYTFVDGTTTKFLDLLSVEDSTTSIDYMFIVAPRIRVRFGNFTLGAEIEYTKASFARPFTDDDWQDDFDCHAKIVCGKPVSNFRFLFATFYDFDFSPFSYK